MKILVKIFKKIALGIGSLVLLIILTSLIGGVLGFKNRPAPLADSTMVSIDFDTALSEISRFDLATQSFTPSIHDVSLALDRIAKDDRVKAVSVRLQTDGLSLVHLHEIRGPLMAMRAAGKKMSIYAEDYMSYTGGAVPYALACHFDSIWLQPTGLISFAPVQAEIPFIRGLLDKVGITPEFSKRAAYKSAPETFLNNTSSPENRAMTERLVQGLNAQIDDLCLTARPSLKQVWDDAKTAQLLTDTESQKLGLIDRLGYYDEYDVYVSQQAQELKAEMIGLSDYMARYERTAPKAKNTPQVGFVLASGIIPEPSMTAEGDGIIAPTVLQDSFHEILKNPDIQHVLVRMDSPGGAPSGAEVIRRSIEQLVSAGKSVYVSMGEAAASGGYWAVVNASHITANPATLTGSIGVYGGKFHAQALWEKIGITWEQFGDQAPSNFLSLNFPMTERDRATLEKMMDHTYDQFLNRVSDGRGIERPTLEQNLAGGRVWLGSEAQAIQLTDATGGLLDVIARIKTDMGLKQTDIISLVYYPEPKTAFEEILSLLNRFMGVQMNISSLIEQVQTHLHTRTLKVQAIEDRVIQ